MSVIFASWPVVEALLDAGADATVTSNSGGFDTLMSMAAFGNSSNAAAWLRRFPEWNLERRGPLGVNALSLAIQIGPNKLETVKVLVAAGADTCHQLDTGSHLLIMLAANIDADDELAE